MIRILIAALAICTSPAFADAPRVVTDIRPIHSLVTQVMQGVGNAEVIVPEGASVHGYALRSSQAGALQEADIVFWIGHELTPWLERPIEALAPSAKSVELIEADGLTLYPYREDVDFHAHDHADHGGGEHDPHIWLDPKNGQVLLAAIAEELAAFDPANAALYRENAARAMADLDDVFETVGGQLASLSDQRLLGLHDAYQYLEARFALPVVASVSLGDASTPGAARIRVVRELAIDEGVSCVLVEPGQDPALAEAVVDGLDVLWVEVDPLGAGLADGPGLYASLFGDISAALAGCRGR